MRMEYASEVPKFLLCTKKAREGSAHTTAAVLGADGPLSVSATAAS